MRELSGGRLAALVVLAAGLGGPVQAQEPFVWRTDLARARAQAAEQGRPLLLVFR